MGVVTLAEKHADTFVLRVHTNAGVVQMDVNHDMQVAALAAAIKVAHCSATAALHKGNLLSALGAQTVHNAGIHMVPDVQLHYE